MQRTLLLAFAMVCALPTFAQADDWSVHHSGFNPRLVQRYKALLHRRPNDGYALAKLIKLYKQHRTVASLIAEYRRRADAHPKSFVYQVIAGHLYRRVGERRKAITYYQRAATLRPKSPSVP
ncbi:MAG: tetratricopeptide repeat protein, partial [Deltaproteobacteria bacterium]|nr:tetratricopeptide repeat protein [Deltaproteobacteria bacterium]